MKRRASLVIAAGVTVAFIAIVGAVALGIVR
jgi:hypothetical protein